MFQNKIFINLPTKDLAKATAFYEAMGFVKNPQFSDENASGLSYYDNIYVMVLTESFMKTFIGNKEISDAHKTAEMTNGISFESKDAVNAFAEKAIAAGANEYRDPYDYGFMYGRSFTDLDGHIWEAFWIDVTQMPAKE